MTSIPVRKGTTVMRRNGDVNEKLTVSSSDSDTDSRRLVSKHQKQNTKLLTRRSSRQELQDENVKLHEEMQACDRKLRYLESTLNITQEELKRSSEESTKVKNTCERTLLTCNIDPVTLEKIPSSSGDNAGNHRRNNTKVKVTILHEKLQLLNSQALACMKGLKDISSELDHNPESTVSASPTESGNLVVLEEISSPCFIKT